MIQEAAPIADTAGGTLTLSSLLAYSMPVGITSFLVIPTAGILQGVYAKYYGLELTTIAIVLLIARVFDGVVDPVIGYLSDRSRERSGSRKPWVVSGGIGMVICAYFLLSPSYSVTAASFLFWLMAFYLAWGLFEIPHIAWGSEITGDYVERSRVYSARAVFATLGSIAFFALPLLPIFGDSQYTPETLRMGVLISSVFMIASLYFLLLRSPDGEVVESHKEDNLRSMIHSIVCNKPLLLFVATYFTAGLGLGMFGGLLFIYLDSYLQLGDQIAMIFLLGSFSGLVAIPLWLMFIRKTSKTLAWGLSMASYVLLIGAMIFIEPGTGLIAPLFVICALFFSGACQGVVAPAILADIVDYGMWKFGRDRAATYFSFYMLITKVNVGISSALGLTIIGLYHFDPTMTIHSEEAVSGMRLALIVIPAFFILLSLIFILLTPINKRRHAIIRKRLDRCQAGGY